MNPVALLLFVLCQDPAPTTPDLDVLELKNGDVLRGRITAEVDGYVELQLEAGAVVGMSTAQVAAIRRGAGGAVAAAAALPQRSEWFVLHDATGSAVGWLSTAVRPHQDGSCTISEEYEFQSGRRRYQVTSLVTAAANRAPQSCYFRERITEPMLASLAAALDATSGQQERIVDERIVEARVSGERLQVQRLDRTGRRERDLAWPTGASFPLLARTFARQSGTGLDAVLMFDPACEDLVERSYDGGRRRQVVLDGVSMQVTEVAETGPSGRNSEWVDATQRTVRREIAGPALVAVPSNAASMKAAVGAVTIPGALVAAADGAFGLWVPNPAWTALANEAPGQIALACQAHGASVALARLDHLEPGCTLDAAIGAVGNWFALLHPELRVASRSETMLRDRAGIRLLATGRRGGDNWRAEVDVVPHRGGFLVLVCTAPQTAWDELAGDFTFLRRSVEFEPQALAPTLQGPLAEQSAPRRSRPQHPGPQDVVPTSTATSTSTAARTPVPARSPVAPLEPGRGVVRIPNDG
ncbi:MAG: hypothetical protein MUC36_27085 [Planctomycetes bacterium]|jgi:hypothetical protein|nr:hypothetical protein [Planctomycetota bacterium]